MCRGRSSIWLTDSRQETAGGLGDEGGFHQGSAEQDEQVEERQHHDVQVATFGSNTAVSHYTFTYDAELKGTHRARTVICSDTWVNDSGTWKTASTHCSLVKGKERLDSKPFLQRRTRAGGRQNAGCRPLGLAL